MHRWFVLAALAGASPAVAATGLPPEASHLVPPDWDQPTTPGGPVWWEALGGEELAGLLGVALSDNVDAQNAALRVDRSDAARQQTASGLWPSLSLGGSASVNPNVNALVFNPDPDAAGRDTFIRGDASADLVVPLTLWKGLPSATAANADVTSATAAADDTRAAVAVQTARQWLDLAYARERLVVEQQVAVDTELATLVEARYRLGASSGTDLLQQRQQLASSRSNLPDAEAAIVRAERTLNVHLRRAPTSPLSVAQEALPHVPEAVTVPSPEALVRSDPTVRTRLADLDAAERRTSAARAGFLPDLNASATAGFTYNDLQSEPVAESWSVGASVSVPLFNGGRNRGALDEARAVEQTEAFELQDAVLELVLEVENALTTWTQRSAEVAADTAALEAAQAALTAARADYEAGQTSYNSVLNALNSQKQAELALLVTRRTQLDAYLDVAAAAAGAWVRGLEAP